jgi:hypothetical protein
MENISKTLIAFSEKHDLWNLTKKSSSECIKNYIEEEIDNNELILEEISLRPQKQELVFWDYENETFIVRTTYSLYKNNDSNVPIGDYAMDVNIEGEAIDDWLVIY